MRPRFTIFWRHFCWAQSTHALRILINSFFAMLLDNSLVFDSGNNLSWRETVSNNRWHWINEKFAIFRQAHRPGFVSRKTVEVWSHHSGRSRKSVNFSKTERGIYFFSFCAESENVFAHFSPIPSALNVLASVRKNTFLWHNCSEIGNHTHFFTFFPHFVQLIFIETFHPCKQNINTQSDKLFSPKYFAKAVKPWKIPKHFLKQPGWVADRKWLRPHSYRLPEPSRC